MRHSPPAFGKFHEDGFRRRLRQKSGSILPEHRTTAQRRAGRLGHLHGRAPASGTRRISVMMARNASDPSVGGSLARGRDRRECRRGQEVVRFQQATFWREVAPAGAWAGDAVFDAALASAFWERPPARRPRNPPVFVDVALHPSASSSPSINPIPPLIHLFMTNTSTTADSIRATIRTAGGRRLWRLSPEQGAFFAAPC